MITQSDRDRLAEDECTEEQINALTAERDALKAELEAERKLSADVDRLTGENERLRAELAAVERCECNPDLTDLEAQLTELREAAEYAVNEWANGMPGRGMERLQAVLAKLSPT